MNHSFRNVCVVGLGYIGLPTAALLANRGHRVFGVDVQNHVVETINAGNIHIVEPDLDSFVRSAVGTGALTAHSEPQPADVFVIAVPTPLSEDRSPQMQYVWDAARMIAPVVQSGNLVILESTSPVGTTETVAEVLREAGADTSSLAIAHCPERVLPGRIMIELSENDRIVGGVDQSSTQRVAEFYRSFVVGDVLETSARTAEMTKLVENASRDVQIAFANELSMLGDRFGVDVWDVIELANHHPRVNILRPGPGVGGHCIAVDPWFLVDGAQEEAVLIRTARERNLQKTDYVVDAIRTEIHNRAQRSGRQASDITVGLFGLAYKPDIDDLRESPALAIARRLKADGWNLRVNEPNLGTHPEFALTELEDMAGGLDIAVLLVAHREYRALRFGETEVMDVCGVLRGER